MKGPVAATRKNGNTESATPFSRSTSPIGKAHERRTGRCQFKRSKACTCILLNTRTSSGHDAGVLRAGRGGNHCGGRGGTADRQAGRPAGILDSCSATTTDRPRHTWKIVYQRHWSVREPAVPRSCRQSSLPRFPGVVGCRDVLAAEAIFAPRQQLRAGAKLSRKAAPAMTGRGIGKLPPVVPGAIGREWKFHGRHS